jgi:hypothetical protein
MAPFASGPWGVGDEAVSSPQSIWIEPRPPGQAATCQPKPLAGGVAGGVGDRLRRAEIHRNGLTGIRGGGICIRQSGRRAGGQRRDAARHTRRRQRICRGDEPKSRTSATDRGVAGVAGDRRPMTTVLSDRRRVKVNADADGPRIYSTLVRHRSPPARVGHRLVTPLPRSRIGRVRYRAPGSSSGLACSAESPIWHGPGHRPGRGRRRYARVPRGRSAPGRCERAA